MDYSEPLLNIKKFEKQLHEALLKKDWEEAGKIAAQTVNSAEMTLTMRNDWNDAEEAGKKTAKELYTAIF